ncbi:MAG: diacylglycerol kinase family protein [Chitinophagales bacterium]
MKTIRSFTDSFRYALDGIAHALITERNMKFHLLATVLVVAFGLYLDLNRQDWLFVIVAIALVLITETINSALEEVVDLISPGYNVKARNAKNMCAGAVFLAALTSVIIGILVFGKYLFNIWRI